MFGWLALLGQQSRRTILLLSLVLVVIVGVLDYITGPELAFTILYLIPVTLTAWYAGRRYGVLISLLCAASWLIADFLTTVHRQRIVPYWNVLVELGFFLLVTFTLVALRNSLRRQEEMSRFIVHDLRSPLANIITGLQTFSELSGDTLDAEQKVLIGVVQRSSERMLTLVNALLDIARLESGRFTLNVQATNPISLVDAAIAQVALWAGAKSITLRADIADAAPSLCVDPDMTQRVLVNLISNAITVSPTGAEVLVRVQSFSDTRAVISVADHGTGIPREWQRRVFEKFARVESRRSSLAGSGLGLAFSKLAIEQQHGRIWLVSEEGQGTTVYFTVPADRM